MKSLQFTIPIIFLSFVSLTSCNKENESSYTGLSGKFVNETFLKQTTDSIPGLIPVYCYELNFTSKDSVDILYGFEQSRLAYKKDGKKYLLVHALQEKDMSFTVNEDKTITLVDSAWNGVTRNSTFKESTLSTKQKWDFENHLNQQLIAGEYSLFKENKQSGQKVNFNADGSVTGLENFKRYNLCYSGDCVGEIYPISNSITFSNEKKEVFTYAFKTDITRKKLDIYQIEGAVKDIKGERAIKELAFDLRR
ncbi:hypothetical protein [Dyadobacter frigoris]|uniref:Lipoprotein n=1 Tax=Dyadobacter frigoris TaxID=2576211 RepID=A0A4U6DBQ0_9BACT|nr:hypothetical protein [Dyadobacter frigoris]TKT91764.1 hypothetical protein FDK13_11430 [Dyadobacter frigoris]GLU55589.1 hypothetical protein Dfri01_50500 [Dyadobacter frigoris]